MVIDRSSVMSNLRYEVPPPPPHACLVMQHCVHHRKVFFVYWFSQVSGYGKRAKSELYRDVVCSILADFQAAADHRGAPLDVTILNREEAVRRGLVNSEILRHNWPPHRLIEAGRRSNAMNVVDALHDDAHLPALATASRSKLRVVSSVCGKELVLRAFPTTMALVLVPPLAPEQLVSCPTAHQPPVRHRGSTSSASCSLRVLAIKRVRADFDGTLYSEPGGGAVYLTLKKDAFVELIHQDAQGWAFGRFATGELGWFPAAYVR